VDVVRSDSPSCHVDGAIARITLASPGDANAIGAAVVAGLQECLERALSEDQVRVIVLAAEGTVFSSGSNIAEFLSKDREALRSDYQALAELYQAFTRSPIPTVARVHGDAYGGALGLIASCDLAIAGETARFAFSEVRLGFAPVLAAIPVLKRVRAHDALELFVTGASFDARRAASIGLVNRCVADDSLDRELEQLVGKICLGAPRAIHIARSVVATIGALPDEAAYRSALGYAEEFVASSEAHEGVRAFIDGRPPSWS
jgi:methylglutaconyl-CoA hydratase